MLVRIQWPNVRSKNNYCVLIGKIKSIRICLLIRHYRERKEGRKMERREKEERQRVLKSKKLSESFQKVNYKSKWKPGSSHIWYTH